MNLVQRVLGLTLLLFACQWGQAGWARTVVYPQPEAGDDLRDAYPLQVLKLALGKTGAAFEFKPHALFMLQARALREVAQQNGLDVVWTMTSREREQALLPIRIPIDRGLLGWRLLLVKDASLPRFAQVRTLADLSMLRGGQGADWPDTAILRGAGLAVDESVRYGDLFQKLAAGRIAYFPRSVQEIQDELAKHATQGFAIEPTLALHYPAAMYFFVSKQQPELAAAISQGLQAALRDGSFEALFERSFGDVLRQVQLDRRRVFELANPQLPPETPLGDARLWYRPTRSAQ